jgi:hypothetical protein
VLHFVDDIQADLVERHSLYELERHSLYEVEPPHESIARKLMGLEPVHNSLSDLVDVVFLVPV